MKHQKYIDIFQKHGENDGCCIILPLEGLNGALDGPFCDILSADYGLIDKRVMLFVRSADDKCSDWVEFKDVPYSVQKEIINQIKNY